MNADNESHTQRHSYALNRAKFTDDLRTPSVYKAVTPQVQKPAAHAYAFSSCSALMRQVDD